MAAFLEQNAFLWKEYQKQNDLMANCSSFVFDENTTVGESVNSTKSYDFLDDGGTLQDVDSNNSLVRSICDLATINQVLALKFNFDGLNENTNNQSILFNHTFNDTIDSSWIPMKNPREMLNPSNANPMFNTIMVSHILTFLIGVIGNTVVICTWWKHSKFRSPTNIFLVSLAIADLFLLFICVPLKTAEYFWMAWNGLNWTCKTVAYVEAMSAMSTVLNLVAVSIERFLVIVFPMRARSWCTLSSTRKGLVLIWALAFALAIPMPFSKRISTMTYYSHTDSVTLFYCLNGEDKVAFGVTIYQLIVMLIVPAFLLVGSYIVVIRQLKASTRSMEGMTQSKSNQHNHCKSMLDRKCTSKCQSHSQTLLPTNNNDETPKAKGCNGSQAESISFMKHKKNNIRRCLRNAFSVVVNKSNFNKEINGELEGDGEAEERTSFTSHTSRLNNGRRRTAFVSLSTWKYLTCCCWRQALGDNGRRRSVNRIEHDQLSECTMSTTYQVTTFDVNSSVKFIHHVSESVDIDQNVNDYEKVAINHSNDKFNSSPKNSPVLSSSPLTSFIYTISKENRRSSSSSHSIKRPPPPQHSSSLPSATANIIANTSSSASPNPNVIHPSNIYTRVHEMYSRNVANNVMEITRTRTKVMHMIVLIVALFLICWGPRLMMDVLVKFGWISFSNLTYKARIIFNLLSFVHSAVNPFVYGLMSSNFRAMVCSMCCGRGNKNRSSRLNQLNIKHSNTMEMSTHQFGTINR